MKKSVLSSFEKSIEGLSQKRGSPFSVQKEPGSVKRPANAVECSCEKNNRTAKKL